MLRKLLKKMLNLGFVENYQDSEMVLYPAAKINIGLYVTNRRPDGFHNISTLFYPIRLCDILEFVPMEVEDQNSDQLVITGLDIPGDHAENLILRACREMRKICDLPFFRIHLHKIIPLGAGLGGGSSDGSAMLKGVLEYAKTKPPISRIKEIALSLGSDCPFFLDPVSSFAQGRGEQLNAVDINLKGYWIKVYNPGIHISTSWAYQEVKLGRPSIPLDEAVVQSVENWRGTVENCFEAPVFRLHPEIGVIKDELYSAGAVFASMSGSGSSVFGIFKDQPELPEYLSEWHVWTERV